MTNELLFPLELTTLGIINSDTRFPVRRVFCVGQNYAAHALEMGSDPNRETPFFFTKPADALHQNQTMPYPGMTSNLHHEVELVVFLKEGGQALTPTEAKNCIFGFATGIDFTRRDLQSQAKDKRRPWDTSKGFEYSGPVSEIVPTDNWQPSPDATIKLSVNDEIRQEAQLNQLIWDIPELLAELSNYYTLKAGDVVFTGTPAGVGQVKIGDKVSASISDLPELVLSIVESG